MDTIIKSNDIIVIDIRVQPISESGRFVNPDGSKKNVLYPHMTMSDEYALDLVIMHLQKGVNLPAACRGEIHSVHYIDFPFQRKSKVLIGKV